MIRGSCEKDLGHIMVVDKACFSDPWTLSNFVIAIRQANCRCVVSTHLKTPVGFLLYEVFDTRIQIVRLAVHPFCQREGVGTALVREAQAERVNRITLEVRETNLPAQLFFKSLGFRAISILSDFYDQEDAYLFQYRQPQWCQV